MTHRLQVGIDFSQKRADLCCLFPDGRLVEAHRPFANSWPGYEQTRDFLLELLTRHQFDGLDISGEATGYYWLPFFQQLAHDPALAAYDPDLFLLNPRWVKWFKKCFAQDDKSDQKDPFYIAERTRTRRPEHPWQALDTLPLRLYTRYRFHLALNLTREKNYFTALLFLKASSYARRKPFADVFGVTSSLILRGQTNLTDLAALPAEALAESFPLDPALALPLQDCLDFGLSHIRFLENLIAQVEAKVAAALPDFPAIGQLSSIPGVGPVYSAAIGVEIGATDRFLHGQKWDKRHQTYRQRTLRDAENAVAKLAGLWWPKNDSGDFVAQDRHLAKSGNRYLRYYLIQAADKMRQHIPEYAQFYQRKFQEVPKHQHKRALVLTARKSVGLFVGLLHRNEAYRSKEVPV